MAAARNSVSPSKELELTRVFDAPPQLVFNAWSSCEHMVNWMGPEGFTVTSCELQPGVGGKFRACLRAPDGTDNWLTGTTLEVDEPHRIVSTSAWEDPAGKPGHETLLTVTFEPMGSGKTRFTLKQTGFDSVESRNGHEGGWGQALDKFVAYVARAAKSGALK
jgi:uncharacterized protein YndB with AHSA1/START domain